MLVYQVGFERIKNLPREEERKLVHPRDVFVLALSVEDAVGKVKTPEGFRVSSVYLTGEVQE